MMTTLFHENGCNFLCTVIMTEYNSLFKRTAGTVADSNSAAAWNCVYLSISCTHKMCTYSPCRAGPETISGAGRNQENH